MFLCDWVRRAAGLRRGAGAVCLLAGLMAAATLAGCPMSSPLCARNSDCEAGNYCSGGSCISDCTPATVADDCAAAESCNSFGMCVAPPDAGMRDAGSPDAGASDAGASDAGASDAGADASDLRAPCVIAGGTDGDGDGYCPAATIEPDCDDADVRVHPSAAEVCTVTGGAAPADENCDGALDEDCSMNVGVPHAVIDIALAGGTQWFPRLSTDGLRLYTTGVDALAAGGAAARPHVATRASWSARFGRSAPVAGAWPAGVGLTTFALAADELDAVLQAHLADGRVQVYLAHRATPSDPFDAPTPLVATTGVWFHPFISEDGLDVYYGGPAIMGSTLFRISRSSRTAAFGAPVPLMIPAVPGTANGLQSPWLLSDGSLLFVGVSSAGSRIFRALPLTSGFATPVEVGGLSHPMEQFMSGVSYSERTRELFFTSARPWSPTGGPITGRSGGVWRAEVCRDGACSPREVACASGMRSPDGTHCYLARSAPLFQAAAAADCAAMGGHLATIHSADENTFVFELLDDHAWIGARQRTGGTDFQYEWETGEPGTVDFWAVAPIVQPGTLPSEDWGGYWAGASEPARWGDWPQQAFGGGLPYVCETEMWPTW